uniref:ABC transporter domain-containing protein n=1 Tax=Leersia perrieri TaxID=77586 RepID=A0A0D9VF54_9ORYZ
MAGDHQVYLSIYFKFVAFFSTHLMAMVMFQFLGAILETMVAANTFGMLVLLVVFVFGGVPNNDTTVHAQTVGKAILTSNGFITEKWAEAKRVRTKSTQSPIVLPFEPLSLCFNHVNYYVDMPTEMKAQGFTQGRLQLLSDISGAFRPGVMTALVGESGAGKTTLMDVLAGRKTSGQIEGSITLSGFHEKPETFARIIGYCEQIGIHSPNITMYESHIYSACLRLPSSVGSNIRKMFVDEVMAHVELNMLRNVVVGLPGVSGLSNEQRKRLTIAVELVANPSIIFMDEPTSGLDARSAAIIMRTVKNIVNTGRTVVCTIHQPSIAIFESFDEAIPGVPNITEGYNPATWMLEISSNLAEAHMNINFHEIYMGSLLYRDSQQDLYNLLGATYAAVLFIGGTNSLAVQPVLSIERAVFHRERAAGMYTPLSYAFAQLISQPTLYQLASVEFIYNSIQGIMYTIIINAMIGYASLPKLPDQQAIPIWWRWYRWANPVYWTTIYSVVASQFGENDGFISVPGRNPIVLKQFLKDEFSIQHDFLGYVVLGHFGYIALFFFIFVYSMKFLNFQKR